MNPLLREPWTVERFLQWEDKQEGRHEFGGTRITEMRITEMTGGSRAHQVIVLNVASLLRDLLDLERFDVLQKMRVQIGRRVRYPDVSVVAGPVPGKVRTLREALVVFEVQSDDTADTDRGVKRADYADIPGIWRYVLLEQDRMAATVLERTAEGWAETEATDDLHLPEIGAVLPFPAIYRHVRF